MKYLWKLLLSLKEIFLMMFLQYSILILCIIIIGIDKSILCGSILLMVIQIIYIILKGNGIKFINRPMFYLPYILIGIGISSVYTLTV